MILDFVAPICRGCFKCLHPAFLSARYIFEKHTRPPKMTKAHFIWNACSPMKELEEVKHFGFAYEATRSAFSEEFRCQLSADFIYFSKSVLCHSAHQPPLGVNSHFPTPQLCYAEMYLLMTPVPQLRDVDSNGQADVLFLNTIP